MNRIPPTLDMRLDGTFRSPPSSMPRSSLPPLSGKLVLGTVLATCLAGAAALVAFALWLLSMALPVLVLLGVGTWAALRFNRWRSGGVPSRYRSP